MKALYLTGPQEVSIRDIPEERVIEPDDVKVQVVYTSICADETALFAQYKQAMKLGHEFSGVIVQLGAEAERSGFSVGDRVTGYTWRFCGKCTYCRRGKENLCVQYESDGAMQDYLVVKDRQLCKIPPQLSLQEACLFELVASCIHGLDRAELRMGDTVLILGGGGAGMILTQLAKLAGASQIVVSEPVGHKRELCRSLGADHVLNPYAEQIVVQGMRLTDGMGYDCIIDACRNEEAVQEAMPLLTRGGTMLLFCMYNIKSRIHMSLPVMYNGELTIRTAYMAPYLQERTMRILPQLDLKPLLSQPFALADAQKAFETACAGKRPRVFLQVNPEP